MTDPKPLVAIALTTIFIAAACTGTNGPDPDPNGQQPSADQTILPLRDGTATLTLDGQPWTVEVPNCQLDPDTARLAIVGFGQTDDGTPFRLDHGNTTPGQLTLAIGTDRLLDPGDQTWTGQPDPALDTITAVDNDFTMTRADDDQTADATLTVECPLD